MVRVSVLQSLGPHIKSHWNYLEIFWGVKITSSVKLLQGCWGVEDLPTSAAHFAVLSNLKQTIPESDNRTLNWYHQITPSKSLGKLPNTGGYTLICHMGMLNGSPKAGLDCLGLLVHPCFITFWTLIKKSRKISPLFLHNQHSTGSLTSPKTFWSSNSRTNLSPEKGQWQHFWEEAWCTNNNF